MSDGRPPSRSTGHHDGAAASAGPTSARPGSGTEDLTPWAKPLIIIVLVLGVLAAIVLAVLAPAGWSKRIVYLPVLFLTGVVAFAIAAVAARIEDRALGTGDLPGDRAAAGVHPRSDAGQVRGPAQHGDDPDAGPEAQVPPPADVP